MKVALLSGKGGTGKTFISVNLAAAMKNVTYIDCDVEEPNGRLFLKPTDIGEKKVYTFFPSFDETLCTGCRECVDFCRFNALVYVKGKPIIFPEVCHSCGGCSLVCPSGAVKETKRMVGVVEEGKHEGIDVITGVLNLGESSAVPVIKEALNLGFQKGKDVVIDCPPGSGCSIMEIVMASDCCALVAEPTAFGFHNFKMVYKLVSLLKKKCFVVINKQDNVYYPLNDFCRDENIKILATLPYSPKFASYCASGKLMYDEDKDLASLFDNLYKGIVEEV